MPTFKEHINGLVSKNGFVLGMLRLLFYPITQIIITPIRLCILLFNSRVLIGAQRSTYSGFVPQTAFNILFYWTRALNIFKYGRKGRSPYIGLGNYPLARTFYYSLGSLYAFWIAPLVTILLGLFGWLLSHYFWADAFNLNWILVLGGLTMISSLFYINIIQQNYNALGWLFFPLFIFGLVSEQWILAAAAIFLASFASITVVMMGGIISFVIAIVTLNPFPLLIMVPAVLKLSLQLIPLFSESDGKGIVVSIMKAIGMSGKEVKYKRSKKGKIDLLFIYFSLLYLQFALVYYLIYNEVNILFITGLLIYWINKLIVRFADEQSTYMLMMSLGFATLAMQDFQIIPLLSYFLMINPFPLTTNVFDPKNIDLVPIGKPFNIRKISTIVETFFKDVQKDQKVFMCFNDPENDYEKIFDGYRRLLELPHYVANLKEFHFMPDWWGVFELNYPGAPDLWGRDMEHAKKNIKEWKSDYLVVYQSAGTSLSTEWKENGFEELSVINWQEIEKDHHYHKFYKPASPSWWLLKVPDNLKS